MSVKGTPTFDTLVLVSLKADIRASTLEASAAFVSSNTGSTHGWTEAKGNIWSKETVSIFQELVKSMEADLSRVHFGTSQASSMKPGLQLDPGGLSEHLSGDGVPSV